MPSKTSISDITNPEVKPIETKNIGTLVKGILKPVPREKKKNVPSFRERSQEVERLIEQTCFEITKMTSESSNLVHILRDYSTRDKNIEIPVLPDKFFDNISQPLFITETEEQYKRYRDALEELIGMKKTVSNLLNLHKKMYNDILSRRFQTNEQPKQLVK